MIKIAFKMYKKALNLQMFTVIQLAAVLTICVFMVSGVYSRLELYLPLKDLLESKASATTFPDVYRVEMGDAYLLNFRSYEPFSDDFGDVSKNCYTRFLPGLTNRDIDNLEFISYCENTYSLYVPELVEGDWLDIMRQPLTEEGAIPAVIGQIGYEYKVGDLIPVSASTYDNQKFDTNIKVCGIIDRSTSIFGNGNMYGNEYNHTMFYQSVNSTFDIGKDDTCAITVFVSQDLIDSCNIGAHFDSCSGIIQYDDSVSDEAVTAKTALLEQKYYANSDNISNVNTLSKRYVASQLVYLIPIGLCVGILTIVTGICTNAVCTKRNIRNYAIYSLCGSSTASSVMICVIQSIFTTLLASAISVVAASLVSKIIKLRLVVNIYTLLLCLVVIILNMVFSTAMPYRILKKSEIRDELK